MATDTVAEIGSTSDQKFSSSLQIGGHQIAAKTCELATKCLVLSRQKRLDFSFDFEPSTDPDKYSTGSLTDM